MERVIGKLKRKLSLVSYTDSLGQLPKIELEEMPDAYSHFLPHICFGYDRSKNVDINFTSPGTFRVKSEGSWFSLEVDIDDFSGKEYLVLILDFSVKKTVPVKVCLRSEKNGDDYYPRVLMFSENKNKIEIPINIKSHASNKSTIIIFFESELFEVKVNEVKILLARN